MYSILMKVESDLFVKKERIKRRIESDLSDHGIDQAEVSLAFVGRESMRLLNKKFRGLSEATCVLSFSQTEKKGGKEFFSSPDDFLRLGDVIVCCPVASEMAQEAGITVDEQIEDLAAHGLLHLLGIHHEE